MLTGNTARKRKRSLSFILITEVRLLDERFLSVFYFLKKNRKQKQKENSNDEDNDDNNHKQKKLRKQNSESVFFVCLEKPLAC